MRIRQANKIRRAAVAYSGGYPHRHRKATIEKAKQTIIWRGWRWAHDLGCMAKYAARARVVYRSGK